VGPIPAHDASRHFPRYTRYDLSHSFSPALVVNCVNDKLYAQLIYRQKRPTNALDTAATFQNYWF